MADNNISLFGNSEWKHFIQLLLGVKAGQQQDEKEVITVWESGKTYNKGEVVLYLYPNDGNHFQQLHCKANHVSSDPINMNYWTEVCNTKVKDVPTTTITSYTDSAISTGILTYRVTNGICYVDVFNINVANTGSTYTIYDSMPKCAITQRAGTTDVNCSHNGGIVILEGETSLKVQTTTTENIYGSFSYPVATD